MIGDALLLLKFSDRDPKGLLLSRASSSLILSAACAPFPDDVNIHLKALQWGVVRCRNANSTVAHYSLTNEEVTAPESDKWQA